MAEPARSLFDQLKTHSALSALIDEGEAEGLYLECKSTQGPKVNQDIKAKLGRSLSAFSNTEGGVLLCGISTQNHAHSNLDILTQIEPIGNCGIFAKSVAAVVPQLVVPPVTN